VSFERAIWSSQFSFFSVTALLWISFTTSNSPYQVCSRFYISTGEYPTTKNKVDSKEEG